METLDCTDKERLDRFHTSAHGGRSAFTLIELLVVIAVLALLVSIMMPSLAKARRMARTVVCRVHLRGYGQATEMYAADNDGVMMDSYRHLDSDVGVPGYWGSRQLPEEVSRCPSDAITEAMDGWGPSRSTTTCRSASAGTRTCSPAAPDPRGSGRWPSGSAATTSAGGLPG